MSKRTRESIRLIPLIILPVIGVVGMLLYVKDASADVIYSDYIRIVSEYLPDVGDPAKLLTPDILTRIPATFLARFINVETFGYSVTFDRVLSVAGLGIMAIVLSRYAYLYNIGFLWLAAIFTVLFSLIKWEIILNGTAWAHIVSFGFFFINYLVIDKLWKGETNPREELLLLAFPLFMLLLAGEYIASYALSMILTSIFGILVGGLSGFNASRTQKIFTGILITTLISILIYMVSRSFAVWDHEGATDMSFSEVLLSDPLYFVVFFLKTFTGAFLGGETIENFIPGMAPLPEYLVLIFGFIIFAAYLFAFYLYFKSELFDSSIFPIILLSSGFFNHILVTVSRWIFLDSDYALSSRYSSQFMIGIIGMFLIFAMYPYRNRSLRRMPHHVKTALKGAALGLTALILAGNIYTTYQEIGKAKYREENFTIMSEMLLNYRDYSAEELKNMLEWTKDDDTLYDAIKILEENRLNVFSK